ncbi:MAG TPA: hypothetical protein VKV33_08105, partial [Streptosporangiaceae bacterium]|nr:hypothetical protein [Streptosporangiaceae bacterium]
MRRLRPSSPAEMVALFSRTELDSGSLGTGCRRNRRCYAVLDGDDPLGLLVAGPRSSAWARPATGRNQSLPGGVGHEAVRQFARTAQRGGVPAVDLVGGDAQPLAGDAAKETGR